MKQTFLRRTVASKTSCSSLGSASLKSILLLLLVVLIHFPNCGHSAKLHSSQKQHRQSQKYLQKSQLLDIMQATQPQKSCHALQPQNMDTDDKLVLSPIVFQGRLISRSNVYNSLYFVSLRVQRVLKGSVPRRMHRHMRLLFHHTDSKLHPSRDTSRDPKFHTSSYGDTPSHQRRRPNNHNSRGHGGNAAASANTASTGAQSGSHRNYCQPVSFDVKAGRKYAVYVKKVATGRYVAIAQPDVYTKKVRKAARKLLCQKCVSSPKVTGLTEYLSVSQGGKFKLKCKVAGSPTPKVTWLKDGRPIRKDIRISIKNKRKRSILRLSHAQGRDAGKYTCRATNVLGEQSQTTSISVRVLAPDPPASSCPIDSFCLNGGKCLYYEMIGELVCRCPEGYAGQRCQFKKARINLPFIESEACGPYGHDIHLREICAAWKRPPVTEMTRQEYESWLRVEQQVAELKRTLELEEMRKFRQMSRPSFVSENSNPNSSITQDDFEYTIHEDYNDQFDHDAADETFLDHYNPFLCKLQQSVPIFDPF